jgi:hypothetical protein
MMMPRRAAIVNYTLFAFKKNEQWALRSSLLLIAGTLVESK